jgi:hypothetical protein
MPYSTYQSDSMTVSLDTDLSVLKNARGNYRTDLLIALAVLAVWLFTWTFIWIRSGFRTTDIIVAPILLMVAVNYFVKALSGINGVGRKLAKKTILADMKEIAEVYRFGRYANAYVEVVTHCQTEIVTMAYNQLMLTTKGGRQVVLPYEMFGTKEKMRSYAEAVCEKAGIVLQVVEGVA